MHDCVCMCVTLPVHGLQQMQDETGALKAYSQHALRSKAAQKAHACCTLEQAEWSFLLPVYLRSCYPTRQSTYVGTFLEGEKPRPLLLI